MQQKLTAENIDDMASDLQNIKHSIIEEKQKNAMVETKLGLIDHLLTDSATIKEVVAKVADKTERRLDRLEELISQTHELKKKVPSLSPSALELAAQGHKKKELEGRHHHSVSFGS